MGTHSPTTERVRRACHIRALGHELLARDRGEVLIATALFEHALQLLELLVLGILPHPRDTLAPLG